MKLTLGACSLVLAGLVAAGGASSVAIAQQVERDVPVLSKDIAERLDGFSYEEGPESDLEFRGTPIALRAEGDAEVEFQDGRARVEVFPKGDLNRNEDLRAFTSAVAGVAPNATGSSMYMVESAKLITGALFEAFSYAVIAMLALLLLLWRSVLDTLLVFIPLGMAALVTAAIAHAVGLPLNFADVIVLPLLLGIGIDTGIHLVHRYRHSPDADLLSTATSRGVIWASATTIDSFGTMGFASHLGLATLGQLLALGVTVTLVSTLVLIPALLAVTSRRGEPAALAAGEVEAEEA